MEPISFVVPGCPVGKGRPRFVRQTGRAYTPEKTARYENFVGMCYIEQVHRQPIYAGYPLRMELNVYMKIPQSVSKTKREKMISGFTRPTKKPDCSNVLKAIEDGLNGIAYSDDSQIVETVVHKYFAEVPRVEVEITEAML